VREDIQRHPSGARPIIKVSWLDASFEFDFDVAPRPVIVSTIGYELPERLTPFGHVGVAAEWLGGDHYRAATFIPTKSINHKEVLKP